MLAVGRSSAVIPAANIDMGHGYDACTFIVAETRCKSSPRLLSSRSQSGTARQQTSVHSTALS